MSHVGVPYNEPLRVWFLSLHVNECIPSFFLALQRPTADGVLRDGHLSLSGLQMRAHAMFSAQGLPLGSDTLEYAWLIDMQAGGLTGRVTVPQVRCLPERDDTVRNIEGMCTKLSIMATQSSFAVD